MKVGEADMETDKIEMVSETQQANMPMENQPTMDAEVVGERVNQHADGKQPPAKASYKDTLAGTYYTQFLCARYNLHAETQLPSNRM